MSTPDLLQYLYRQRLDHEPHKERFFAATHLERAALFREVTRVRDVFLDDCTALSRRDWPELDEVWKEFSEYAHRCDWAILDAIVLATCLSKDPHKLGQQLGPCLLVYQAMRMIDDVVDDHLHYKRLYSTAYGILQLSRGQVKARGLTFIAAAALLVHGVTRLPARTLCAVQAVATATLKEVDGLSLGNMEDYSRIVEGKMVAYSSIFYDPIIEDLEDCTEIRDFLARSFRLGQVLNDLHDLQDDKDRLQPNFWLLHSDPEAAESDFIHSMDDLVTACRCLPAVLRPYGHARIADLAGYAIQSVESSTKEDQFGT
ncbi:MAG: class 1 isoprenoid biosynthesis enzyme [Egibacteraceae bacterium]